MATMPTFRFLERECAQLDFLRILKSHYPDKLIVLVLDNARIHHAKMVKEFLRQEGESFHLIFLPPYSP
ncbi:transposase [Thermolongibacillus altinsuensis]